MFNKKIKYLCFPIRKNFSNQQSYIKLCVTFEKISTIPSKLEKLKIYQDYLREVVRASTSPKEVIIYKLGYKQYNKIHIT